jgi:hypothetical protein
MLADLEDDPYQRLEVELEAVLRLVQVFGLEHC